MIQNDHDVALSGGITMQASQVGMAALGYRMSTFVPKIWPTMNGFFMRAVVQESMLTAISTIAPLSVKVILPSP